MAAEYGWLPVLVIILPRVGFFQEIALGGVGFDHLDFSIEIMQLNALNHPG